METDGFTWIGAAAGLCTTIAFVPQLLKVLKTKSAEDVSAGLLIIFSCGVGLWLIYGIVRRDLPMIGFNAVTLLLALAILVLKIYYAIQKKTRDPL